MIGNITQVGHIVKPHGIKGEVSAIVDPEVDIDSLRCLIVNIDNIPVPFFVSSWRARGAESVLLKFDDIDSEQQAKMICGKPLFALDSELDIPADDDPDGAYADQLIGYSIVSPQGHSIGEITDIDTSTPNALFVVETPDNQSVLIPIADEFVVEINQPQRQLVMSLPEGLLDIQ